MAEGYHPDARSAIGAAQQLANNYPLVAPSAEIVDLLADAHFAYDDPSTYDSTATAWQVPFSLKWLYGFGCIINAKPSFAPTPTHAADVLIVDALGQTVFDSTLATYATRAWGPRLRIHTWRSATASLTLTQHKKWPTVGEPSPHEYTIHIAPTRAELLVRTLDRIPSRVRTATAVLTAIGSGSVELHSGYNTAVTYLGQVTRGLRKVHRVGFAVTPGAGLGIYPGCTPDALYVRSVNNVAPTADGRFFIDAAGCMYATQPKTLLNTDPLSARPVPATLAIGDNCAPCCACNDLS